MVGNPKFLISLSDPLIRGTTSIWAGETERFCHADCVLMGDLPSGSLHPP